MSRLLLVLLLLLSVWSCSPGDVSGTGTNAGNGKVEAFVVYPSGFAAPKADIFLRKSEYVRDTSLAKIPRIADRVTTCSGYFTFDSLPDGEYTLEINDRQSYSYSCPIIVVNGNVAGIEDTITLFSGGHLQGSVLLEDIPVSVPVYVQLRGMEYVQLVAEDGGFYFDNIPPGEHLVNVVTGKEESGEIIDYSVKTLSSKVTVIEDLSLPISLVKDTLYMRMLLDTNGLQSVPVSEVTENAKGRIYKIDLKNRGIAVIPRGMGRMRCRFINFNDNSISLIPKGLHYNSVLVGLEMRNNGLTTIPESISAIRHLKYLDLSGNSFSSGVDALTNCTDLTELRLDSCGISQLPLDLGKLDSLKILYLQNNELTTLPKSVHGLTVMQELNVNKNRLLSLNTQLEEWISTYSVDQDWKETQKE